MNFQTRGHDRTKLGKSVVQRIFALRREGYTCSQIAKMTNTGESTVARYTSDWYQSERKKGFSATRGVHSPKPIVQRIEIVNPTTVTKAVEQQTSKPKKAKKKVVAKNDTLPSDVIDYINKIYQSHSSDKGSAIGNFFIRIGKMLGGRDSI